jgi:hypothetical protein
MLGVAQSANQGYDVQPELALGERQGTFLLWTARATLEFALGVHAAAHHQPEPHQPSKGGYGTGGVVGDPQLPPAD